MVGLRQQRRLIKRPLGVTLLALKMVVLLVVKRTTLAQVILPQRVLISAEASVTASVTGSRFNDET